MEYLLNLGILVGLYLILAQGFNLTFGLGGLFNLSHIASYAIGAYTGALLSTEYDMPFLGCVVVAMFLSALFALLIGAISVRLESDYFAIGTLAFSSVVSALLVNWKSLTRGVLGIPGIPRPTVLGIDFQDNSRFLLLLLGAVIFSQVIVWCLFRARFARILRAQSEFESAAQSLGMNTRLTRNLTFVFASALAGLAGCFFAFYINYIDPSSFGLGEMIFVLTVVIVGRPGSFWGVTFAAAFLVLLPEALRFVELPPGVLGPLRQLLYAVILFVSKL